MFEPIAPHSTGSGSGALLAAGPSLSPSDSGNGTQLQIEHSCLALAKLERRRARLNPIKEFDVALLARFDEVDRIREILPRR